MKHLDRRKPNEDRKLKEYLIIDGYNLINAWTSLKNKSRENLEDARTTLIDMMVEFQAISKNQVIIVFDAYNVKSKKTKKEKVNGVEVVYTKEHQTADSYIEIIATELTKNKRNIVKVVTSDFAEQQIVLGSGGVRVLPRELKIQYDNLKKKLNTRLEESKSKRDMLHDRIDKDTLAILEKWRKQDL